MAETGRIQVYLGEQETTPGDDSVFGSESETEDGSLEVSPLDSASAGGDFPRGSSIDNWDGGCVSRRADPDYKHTSHKSRFRDAGDGKKPSAPVVKTSVPNYYKGDEYFFGYPRRGLALIINNITFNEKVTKMESRPESVNDEEMLKEVFETFGFEVKVHQDLKADEMKIALQHVARADHSEEDCFACAVLTHGECEMSADKTRKEDIVFGIDGEAVPVNDLLDILSDENCPSLEYKPRLFFLQACRGVDVDEGQDVDVYEEKKCQSQGAPEDVTDAGEPDDKDDEPVGISVTMSRDFLVACGAPPGYFAFLRNNGSWFVQSFYNEVTNAQDAPEPVSLVELLTRAAGRQGREFESDAPSNPTWHKKKCVSHITHTLTKDVIFQSKDPTATGP